MMMQDVTNQLIAAIHGIYSPDSTAQQRKLYQEVDGKK
jgi:hypothetical protein